jgi:hypothetical protein
VLRGEDLRGRDGTHPEVLELPLVLAPWEPDYPLAIYRAAELEVPDPAMEQDGVRMLDSTAGPAGELDRADAVRALTDLVEVWTTESNGAARAVAVRGGPAEAVATLGYGAHRLGRLDASQALARMAWAAASGGAYGVRRGAALGRFDAWWAAAALAGVDWPPEPDELGGALERLSWWCWDDATAALGWNLRLAVADPAGGWAVALEASDRTE